MWVQPTHTRPRSFATLRIPRPSDTVLTTAYSSLSAVESDTTCCHQICVFDLGKLDRFRLSACLQRDTLSVGIVQQTHHSNRPLCLARSSVRTPACKPTSKKTQRDTCKKQRPGKIEPRTRCSVFFTVRTHTARQGCATCDANAKPVASCRRPLASLMCHVWQPRVPPCTECVNNCQHLWVVLVLCLRHMSCICFSCSVFSPSVSFLSFPIDPWLSLSRPLNYLSAQCLSFVFDVTSAARRVRRLSRDRRCENNHRHLIDSW